MLHANHSNDRWLWWMALVLALAAGAWLRFWQIDSQILVDDEWHAIHRLMQAGYREIFLSFGHADYSIPLTLLFNWMAETIGLSERRLRALPLLFGMVTIVLVPLALRPWLKRNEQAVLAVLIAISPVLIHFARFVRPYAIVIPLGFLAVIALWRWWHEGDRRWLAVYVPATVVCAWLHPLTMLFTMGALSWFGMAALWRGYSSGNWRRLASIAVVGALTAVLAAALVLPPLLADPDAMASKSGMHRLEPATLLRALEFYAGTTVVWLLALCSALMAIGAGVLWRRDRFFVLYWSYLFVLACLVIYLLDAAWIHHGMVLVRYTAIFVPFLIVLMATGLVACLHAGARFTGMARTSPFAAVGSLVFAGLLYFNGPLPFILDGTNQFTSSMRYHYYYNFDPDRNVFERVLGAIEIPGFYDDIAQAPGDWEVIESPWYFESHYNPLTEYQQFHQQKVRIGMMSGLCADWTHGELEPDSDQEIHFRHFVFLRDLLDEPDAVNRFVVMRRQSPIDGVREIPDIEPCIDAFRERYGPPWHEGDEAVVFRLEAGQPE